MHNCFEIAFAKTVRIISETEKMIQVLNGKSIFLGFIKGYALLNYYPHTACRKMQDIDCVIKTAEEDKIYNSFIKEGYSLTPIQSKIEKKINAIKLMGTHVFAYEFHKDIHTSYLKKNLDTPEKYFENGGKPKPEILFLSVLLHHKFSECYVRDLFDLYFIINENKNLDWEFIFEYCRNKSLTKQFFIIKDLSLKILKYQWPCDKKFSNKGLIYNFTKNLVIYLKLKYFIWTPVKRGIFTKICDALSVVFIYDDLSTAAKVFYNKYIGYVIFNKFLKILTRQ